MFPTPGIINKADMNIVEHVSLLYVGAPFGYMPRNGIARYSGSIMYSFLKNHHMLLLLLQTHERHNFFSRLLMRRGPGNPRSFFSQDFVSFILGKGLRVLE